MPIISFQPLFMRLFVSINLPQDLENYLFELQTRLPQARMSLPRSFHVTLKFLGEIEDDSMYDKVVSALGSATAKCVQDQPLECVLKNRLGFFRHGKFIRVVFVDVQFPQAVFSLQEDIEKDFGRLGFAIDHNFVPHITLARIKYYEGVEFEHELIKIPVEQHGFMVDEIFLMESALSGEVAKYTVRERFTLLK